MNLKTLFVSDLDGTLLDRNAVLSDYSKHTINELIKTGMNFTVATARSPWSASIIKELDLTCPAVMMNGVCVYDTKAPSFKKIYPLSEKIMHYLIPIVHEHSLSGFLYTVKDNEILVFYENVITPHAISFMNERIQKFGKVYIRAYPFTEYDFSGMTSIYYTVSDKKDALDPFYQRVKNIEGLRSEFYRDVYNKDLWYLELLSENASKANAVNFMKKNYGYDRVVAFGDNLNDLPLFELSDYCLAVENAHAEVKNKANEIIKSNTENGVAEWLKVNYSKFI